MAVEGVDYSWARPSPTCLYQNGKRFVFRYLGDDDTGENLRPAERDQLHAAGLRIGLVWQTGKAFMIQGTEDEGLVDANIAKTQARELGQPTNLPIFFSLDVDPNVLTSTQWSKCENYLEGVHTVLGVARTGVYGGYRAIERLVPTYAAWGWQTYAWSSFKVGGRMMVRWSDKAHLRQYRNDIDVCGGRVDLTRSVIDNLQAVAW